MLLPTARSYLWRIWRATARLVLLPDSLTLSKCFLFVCPPRTPLLLLLPLFPSCLDCFFYLPSTLFLPLAKLWLAVLIPMRFAFDIKLSDSDWDNPLPLEEEEEAQTQAPTRWYSAYSQYSSLALTCAPVWCCSRAAEWPARSNWVPRPPQRQRPRSQVGRLGGCVCLRMEIERGLSLGLSLSLELQLLLQLQPHLNCFFFWPAGWSASSLMCEKVCELIESNCEFAPRRRLDFVWGFLCCKSAFQGSQIA